MKYNVTVPYAVFVTTEVEADSKEEAEENAINKIYISGYCGNDGTDKLIGITEGSIEAGDTPLEDGGFSIEVEEV
jgi:hypothetical protein